MDISGRRSVGRVHVRVCVEIDETYPFIAFSKRFDDTLGFIAEPFASLVNFGEVLELFFKARQRVRSSHGQVAAIVYFIAELGDLLRESRHANRCWTKMHARHALAVAQRHAENADGLTGAGLL